MDRAVNSQDDLKRGERRGEDRVDFNHPLQVVTDDKRQFTFVGRDLSTSGIRLVGPHGLLGQKVHLLIPKPNGAPWSIAVRILWTCPVDDNLVENGGVFLVGPDSP
jgi:hypothetical protein